MFNNNSNEFILIVNNHFVDYNKKCMFFYQGSLLYLRYMYVYFFHTAAGSAMVPCRMSENSTILCERYVYTSVEQWQVQKDNIDQILKQYTDNILFLKVLLNFTLDHFLCVSNVIFHYTEHVWHIEGLVPKMHMYIIWWFSAYSK